MNRNRCRAASGAAAITATLLASGVGVSPALAASGDHGVHAGKHSSDDSSGGKGKADKGGKDHADKGGKDKSGSKGHKDKLAKSVDQVDGAFERLLSRADKKLGDESYERVAANITADRALLAQLTTVEDVRALQPENYEQVISWLRKAERLAPTAQTQDPALTEAAATAVKQLLTISASSHKDDLRAARHLLRDVKELVEVAEGDETETGAEEETEDDSQDETEDDSDDESETGEGGESDHAAAV